MKLDNFFHPQSILIVGASSNSKKLGAQVLSNVIGSGYLGQIIPINLKGGRISSLRVYPNISELSRGVKDISKALAVVVIPASIVPMEIENLAKAGVKNIIIISAGFKEAGHEGKLLEDKLISLASAYNLNILGPNCLGFINHFSRLNASFSKSYGLNGSGVAVFSQSGAIGSAVLDWSLESGAPLPLFVSLGNKAVLNETDFLNYFLENKHSVEYKNTSAIVLYLEEFSDGRELIRVVSQLSRYKSVAILKSGKTSAGALAAKSHTGSMTGSWLVAEAALKRAGAIILDDLTDLFSFLEFSRRPFTLKPVNLAIISNAGGPAVLATDASYSLGLKLGPLNKKIQTQLAKIHISNPLDLVGDAKALDYRLALQNILADRNFNSVLIILSPQTSSEIEATAKEIALLTKKYPKKIIVTSFIGGKALKPALEILSLSGVPNFDSPELALNIISKLNSAVLNQLKFDPVTKEKIIKTKKVADLNYIQAMHFLRKYSIKTAKTVSLAKIDSLKMPLALKASGPDFIHKTDKKAVYLNIDSEIKLNKAIDSLKKIGAEKNDNIIVAQEMLISGQEILVSFKRDSSFGPVFMIGAGGIYTEVLKDFVLLFSDFKQKDVLQAISNLKIYQLLSGARGKDSLDIKSLAKVLLSLQKIAMEFPDISELEINPVIVYKKGVAAADVRVIK